MEQINLNETLTYDTKTLESKFNEWIVNNREMFDILYNNNKYSTFKNDSIYAQIEKCLSEMKMYFNSVKMSINENNGSNELLEDIMKYIKLNSEEYGSIDKNMQNDIRKILKEFKLINQDIYWIKWIDGYIFYFFTSYTKFIEDIKLYEEEIFKRLKIKCDKGYDSNKSEKNMDYYDENMDYYDKCDIKDKLSMIQFIKLYSFGGYDTYYSIKENNANHVFRINKNSKGPSCHTNSKGENEIKYDNKTQLLESEETHMNLDKHVQFGYIKVNENKTNKKILYKAQCIKNFRMVDDKKMNKAIKDIVNEKIERKYVNNGIKSNRERSKYDKEKNTISLNYYQMINNCIESYIHNKTKDKLEIEKCNIENEMREYIDKFIKNIYFEDIKNDTLTEFKYIEYSNKEQSDKKDKMDKKYKMDKRDKTEEYNNYKYMYQDVNFFKKVVNSWIDMGNEDKFYFTKSGTRISYYFGSIETMIKVVKILLIMREYIRAINKEYDEIKEIKLKDISKHKHWIEYILNMLEPSFYIIGIKIKYNEDGFKKMIRDKYKFKEVKEYKQYIDDKEIRNIIKDIEKYIEHVYDSERIKDRIYKLRSINNSDYIKYGRVEINERDKSNSKNQLENKAVLKNHEEIEASEMYYRILSNEESNIKKHIIKYMKISNENDNGEYGYDMYEYIKNSPKINKSCGENIMEEFDVNIRINFY